MIACLALAASVFASQTPGRVVMSAVEFHNQLGIVYPNPWSHLYIMGEDGSGLRQLTFGNEDDLYPTLSLTGRRIWFWKNKHVPNQRAVYQLCSINLDGTDLRRTQTKILFTPVVGLEQALERYPSGTLKIDPDDDSESITVYGKGGKRLVDDAALSFTDDGRYAINNSSGRRPTVCGDDVTQVIDLGAGTVTDLNTPYQNAGWLGRPLMEANLKNDGKSLAVLDRFGHVLVHHRVTHPKFADGLEGFYDEVWDGGQGVDPYGLWKPGIFLLSAHHQMSDGGFDYCYRVDLYTGKADFVGEDELESVSPDGLRFLGAEYNWVGGYKGPGATKLCKLYLWDAKKLTKKPIGLRLMTCNGACFVPGR